MTRINWGARTKGRTLQLGGWCLPQINTANSILHLCAHTKNIMSDKYAVYILASKKNGVLYVGVTNNLWRRFVEHKYHQGSVFVRKYAIDRLVFYQSFYNVKEAIAQEKRLKRWWRAWKIRLIEELNPEWEDLSKNWHGIDEVF